MGTGLGEKVGSRAGAADAEMSSLEKSNGETSANEESALRKVTLVFGGMLVGKAID